MNTPNTRSQEVADIERILIQEILTPLNINDFMNLLSNYGSARYHNNPDDSQVAYDRIVWFYQSLCEKLSSP